MYCIADVAVLSRLKLWRKHNYVEHSWQIWGMKVAVGDEWRYTCCVISRKYRASWSQSSNWSLLTLWRRNFLLNFSTPVFKMWIIQKPKKVALWNKRHFEEREKNGDYAACLKYSVHIFVEYIYKMQHLEVSCAVRPIYWPLGVKWLSALSSSLHCRLTRSYKMF